MGVMRHEYVACSNRVRGVSAVLISTGLGRYASYDALVPSTKPAPPSIVVTPSPGELSSSAPPLLALCM